MIWISEDVLQGHKGSKLIGYRIIMSDPVPVQKCLVYAEVTGSQDVYFEVVPYHEAFFFACIHGSEGLMVDFGPGFIMSHNL